VFDITAQKDGNFQICIGVMIVSKYEIGKSFWSMSQEVWCLLVSGDAVSFEFFQLTDWAIGNLMHRWTENMND